MRSARPVALLAWAAALWAGAGAAQEGTTIRQPFRLEPVLLDSENSESTSLGLAFELVGSVGVVENDDEDTSDALNVDVTLRGHAVDYSFSGTVTQDSVNNPENLIEGQVAFKFFRSAAGRPAMRAGGFAEYETIQNLDEKQLVYGGTVTLAKLGVLGELDYFALDFNIGQVDPSEDTQRQEVLGPDLSSYTRADFEFLYSFNLANVGNETFDTLEFNYRYFMELDPDGAIEDADLDRFKYSVLKLTFANNLFIAYATGKLPFDRNSDQLVKLGFSYNLRQ